MADDTTVPKNPSAEDLGIGKQAVRDGSARLLNSDGSFNVERSGLGFLQSLNLYHWLVTAHWATFCGVVIAAYLTVNLLFAFGYVACGQGAITGVNEASWTGRLLESFFFSVHTFSTIGYGALAPHNLAANVLVTVEAIAGMFGVALATGLLFARFSRPKAKILFSESAVIAPHRGGAAFMFRVANARNTQIVDLQAQVVLSRVDPATDSGRRFYPLTLERSRIMFFPLHWVVAHPIDSASPLWGISEAELRACRPEFMILLRGVDETFLETIQTRSSYVAERIRWGAAFVDMYAKPRSGRVRVNLDKLSVLRPAAVGARLAQEPEPV